ncbi:MAG: acyltransferase [Nitrosomonadales bacterium]|nr:acyltransferase [Nitrosomonadales bacterium]
MKLSEIKDRIEFWKDADRLGPDIPYTHWRLHFKSTMLALCRDKFSHFGEGAEFRPGAYAICCSKISLGRRVIIRPGSMLFADSRANDASIVIGDDVMLGSGVHIYVHNHRFDDPDKPIIDQGFHASKPVVLKKGCWVGANTTVLPGVTIGENAVVGAGSVVTKDVPDRTVAVGNPARVVRKIGKV